MTEKQRQFEIITDAWTSGFDAAGTHGSLPSAYYAAKSHTKPSGWAEAFAIGYIARRRADGHKLSDFCENLVKSFMRRHAKTLADGGIYVA